MSTNQNQILLSCNKAAQEPGFDWTSEVHVDMTSIHDDFWAFFGQIEEEWNALNQGTWTRPSSFPTYVDWAAQDECDTCSSMVPTDDVQMTDDDAVRLPELATCDLSPFAGGVGTGYIDPSVIFSTQHSMSGGAFPGNAAPLTTEEEEEKEERETMETIAHVHTNICTECKTRISEPPSQLRGIIRDLEHMYTEAWKELRRERHRSSRFRRLLDELRAKRLEALQQHEVSGALKKFEGRYQEVRDELKSERNKSFTYKKMAFTEKANYSGFLAPVAELEEMNAKLQGKYEAAMAMALPRTSCASHHVVDYASSLNPSIPS
ncbi:hypothetical protein BJX62DRAFT_243949 [Aspergillus germanicus]